MKNQISRRDFLRLAAVAGVGGVLAGCGVTPTPTMAPPAAKPTTQPTVAAVQPTSAAPQPTTAPQPTLPPLPKVRRGGQVITSNPMAYPTWDVHTSVPATYAGQSVVFETLLNYELVDQEKMQWELQPALAEKWEQPDPKTIVFYLRKGVKFHDGSNFNAEVAKWNIDRMRTEPKSQARTPLAAIDSVEAVDASTIRIKLKTPSAAMLRLLSRGGSYSRGMMSKAQFEKLGADGFSLNPSGTGPMKLKSWKQDDRAILEPFKDYWQNGVDGKPLPYIDELVDRLIPDTATALVALQSGNIHYANVLPKDIATIKTDPNLALFDMTWVGTQYFVLGFKMTEKPFDDIRVRQAMICSIDREGMNKVAGFGVAKVSPYPYWTVGALGYDESIPKNAFDLDKAKKLLTEAGYPNGFETTLKTISREPDNSLGQYQQQVWAKIGIKVQLQALERLTWLDDMAAMRFQAAFWRVGALNLDPTMLATAVTCAGSINFTKWCDKDVDALMAEGDQTLDEKKRREIYGKVLTRIQEQAYVGTGILVPNTVAHSKKLHGVMYGYEGQGWGQVWLDA